MENDADDADDNGLNVFVWNRVVNGDVMMAGDVHRFGG